MPDTGRLKSHHRAVVGRVSADASQSTSFKPWACPECSAGTVSWFASDLTETGLFIVHKFACNDCGYIERLTVPFTAAKQAE